MTKDQTMLLEAIYYKMKEMAKVEIAIDVLHERTRALVAVWRLEKTLENTKREIEELKKRLSSYVEKKTPKA
jgi:succinate dehydrogenase/fumarate reductase flavoprotein subunit